MISISFDGGERISNMKIFNDQENIKFFKKPSKLTQFQHYDALRNEMDNIPPYSFVMFTDADDFWYPDRIQYHFDQTLKIPLDIKCTTTKSFIRVIEDQVPKTWEGQKKFIDESKIIFNKYYDAHCKGISFKDYKFTIIDITHHEYHVNPEYYQMMIRKEALDSFFKFVHKDTLVNHFCDLAFVSYLLFDNENVMFLDDTTSPLYIKVGEFYLLNKYTFSEDQIQHHPGIIESKNEDMEITSPDPSIYMYPKCNCCDEQTKKRCSKCKKVFYCSQAHQKQDWAYHKLICKP